MNPDADDTRPAEGIVPLEAQIDQQYALTPVLMTRPVKRGWRVSFGVIYGVGFLVAVALLVSAIASITDWTQAATDYGTAPAPTATPALLTLPTIAAHPPVFKNRYMLPEEFVLMTFLDTANYDEPRTRSLFATDTDPAYIAQVEQDTTLLDNWRDLQITDLSRISTGTVGRETIQEWQGVGLNPTITTYGASNTEALRGNIRYIGGRYATFNTVMTLENNAWRIKTITITPLG